MPSLTKLETERYIIIYIYIIHFVYNLILHVMLDDNFIIIWTSDCYVLLVCIYDTVESGIKQLNCI